MTAIEMADSKAARNYNCENDIIFQSFRRSLQTIAIEARQNADTNQKRNSRRNSMDSGHSSGVNTSMKRSDSEGAGPSHLWTSCACKSFHASSDKVCSTAAASITSNSKNFARSRPKSISRRSSTSDLVENYGRFVGNNEKNGRDFSATTKDEPMKELRPRRKIMISALKVDFSVKNNEEVSKKRNQTKVRGGRNPGCQEKAKNTLKQINSVGSSRDSRSDGINHKDIAVTNDIFQKYVQSNQFQEFNNPTSFAETTQAHEPHPKTKQLRRQTHAFVETQHSPFHRRASISGPSTKLNHIILEKNTKLRKVSSEANRRHRKYKLGDTAQSKADCLLCSDKENSAARTSYLIAISSLNILDFSFVKRSNGQLTYAVLLERFFDENIKYGGKRGEECMKFVLNSQGATKTIRKGLWLDMIRLVNGDGDDGDCDGVKEEFCTH